jgi:hypothetical protein
MLSEIFILRLEAILRSPKGPSLGNSDTRFVPIKPPTSPSKDSAPGGKQG